MASTIGQRDLRTDYPERDTDNPHLVADVDLTDEKESEGLNNGW